MSIFNSNDSKLVAHDRSELYNSKLYLKPNFSYIYIFKTNS